MQAKIIDRKWVVEWFDERQCYHMPSLTLADNGNLLAVWNGGFLQWNGDPMGRDAKDWVSVLEPGAKEWSNPDAVGCDIRYCCHDPVFLKNKKGEIILLFAKFLDTEVNFTTWCNGRDELWTRKTKDGGRTWEPAQPAGIQSGHASNDSVLLDDGTIVFASTSSELPDKYFGAVRIYLSHDDGETWEKGPILSADDGNLIREPAPSAGRHHPYVHAYLSGQYGLGRGREITGVVYSRKPGRRQNLDAACAHNHPQ